jgi:hypothetical protein
MVFHGAQQVLCFLSPIPWHSCRLSLGAATQLLWGWLAGMLISEQVAGGSGIHNPRWPPALTPALRAMQVLHHLCRFIFEEQTHFCLCPHL